MIVQPFDQYLRHMVLAPNRDIPLLRDAIVKQPAKVPHIDQTPPEIAVPARITPEILSSARSLPMSGGHAVKQRGRIRPHMKAYNPLNV